MLLKLIEAFVPALLLLMHPFRYIPKWFPLEGEEHFAPQLLALDQSSSRLSFRFAEAPSGFQSKWSIVFHFWNADVK
jgi:hypothetical protein